MIVLKRNTIEDNNCAKVLMDYTDYRSASNSYPLKVKEIKRMVAEFIYRKIINV